MTVEDLSKDTVTLFAEKVRFWFACAVACLLTYNLGDNDEQGKNPQKIPAAQFRRLGLDHVFNHKLDLDKSEECQHGGHDFEAEEEDHHRAADHLPPHHPPSPYHLCHHLL